MSKELEALENWKENSGKVLEYEVFKEDYKLIKQALEDKNNQLKVLRNERTIWVNENTELMEGNIKLSNRIKKLKALVIDLDNGKGNEIKLNKQLQSKLDNFKEYVYLKNLLIMDSNYRRKYYKNNPNQDVRIDCKRLNELKNILEISKLESLGDEKNEWRNKIIKK